MVEEWRLKTSNNSHQGAAHSTVNLQVKNEWPKRQAPQGWGSPDISNIPRREYEGVIM